MYSIKWIYKGCLDCDLMSTQVQMSHGYQLLGHAVLQLLTVKIKQAWLAEKQVRFDFTRTCFQ